MTLEIVRMTILSIFPNRQYVCAPTQLLRPRSSKK
jgi:hypothetical protein